MIPVISCRSQVSSFALFPIYEANRRDDPRSTWQLAENLNRFLIKNHTAFWIIPNAISSRQRLPATAQFICVRMETKPEESTPLSTEKREGRQRERGNKLEKLPPARRRRTTREEGEGHDDEDDDRAKQSDTAERGEEPSGEASRGANINATPQTADVAPITNLTLAFSSRLARSSKRGGRAPRTEKQGGTRPWHRLTSPDVAYLPASSSLSLPSLPAVPSTFVDDVGSRQVCVQLRMQRRGRGGGTARQRDTNFRKGSLALC